MKLTNPENENAKVWRYMDFTKFISLIDSHCLYFTRADKFNDPFEGSLSKKTYDDRNEWHDKLKEKAALTLPQNIMDQYCQQLKSTGDITQRWRKFYAINCWHLNEHESDAMWQLYLKSDEGIAIQSTCRKLKESFCEDENVYLGKVIYIDYEKDRIENYYDSTKPNPSIISSFAPFMYKRKSFEHEKEVRALIFKSPEISGESLGDYLDTIDDGVEVKINVEHLVENIYVAPTAPDWFAALVKSVSNHYNFNFNIIRSKLNNGDKTHYRPLF